MHIIPFNCAPGAGCTMTLTHSCYIFLSCQSYRPKDDKDERHRALSSVPTAGGTGASTEPLERATTKVPSRRRGAG